MNTALGMLSIPVALGAGGYVVGEATTMSAGKATAGRSSGRPTVSHFETLDHLMMRRSPSAHRDVIGCGSHAIGGNRGEIR